MAGDVESSNGTVGHWTTSPAAPSVGQASSKTVAPENGRASGRWTKEEHEEFLRCLQIYGREWKKTSERITTRAAPRPR